MNAFVLLSALIGAVWTVDDNGPADFPSIVAAVAAVAPGDVLLVMPGDYASFTLGKKLTILSSAAGARPRVTGRTRFQAAAGFTAVGLDLQEAIVFQVSGPGLLDDCRVGVFTPPVQDPALRIDSCQQLTIQGCEVRGFAGPDQSVTGGTGVKADGSTVVLTDCVVEGGRGWDADCIPCGGGNAGPAIAAKGGSLLTVAGCATIRGGRAGWGDAGISWPPPDGCASDGIRAEASMVLIRGELSDCVEPGSPEYGTPAHAIVAEAGSQVAWSGISLGSPGVMATASTVVVPAVPEPFLEILGPGQPGTVREFQVHGPFGASALVVFGFPGPAFALHGFGSTFWIALPPVVVVSVMTAGYWPVPLPLTLPATPGLEGVSLSAQAVFPGLPSPFSPDVFVTNPATVVVRF